MPFSIFYLPATPKLLYHGFEDNWVSQPWPLPQVDGTTFAAQLSCDVQPIEKVAEWLGTEDSQQLLRDAWATVRDWSGQGYIAYTGYDGLGLPHQNLHICPQCL